MVASDGMRKGGWGQRREVMVSSQSSSRSASQRPASQGAPQARANCLPLVTEPAEAAELP